MQLHLLTDASARADPDGNTKLRKKNYNQIASLYSAQSFMATSQYKHNKNTQY